MKKAVPAIAATAAGVTWLLHAQGVIDASASSKGSRAPTTLPVNQAASGATSTTQLGSTSSGPTTSASAGGTRTANGPVVDTRYGPVQVEVILRGSKLTDVKTLQYPSDRRRSQEINAQALPILHDQAIAAQSAQIDGVSGATYTTTGYEQSLQAALDKVK
jgi:uncharacterized protein with FMN-binding domain